MKVYIVKFSETEEWPHPFQRFFSSRKKISAWAKLHYDKPITEDNVFIEEVNIPTDKRRLIGFLNIYFGDGSI
jgi:hypothetical protein